jgi:hypothetical protein
MEDFDSMERRELSDADFAVGRVQSRNQEQIPLVAAIVATFAFVALYRPESRDPPV